MTRNRDSVVINSFATFMLGIAFIIAMPCCEAGLTQDFYKNTCPSA
jgi:hypothetical protein